LFSWVGPVAFGGGEDAGEPITQDAQLSVGEMSGELFSDASQVYGSGRAKGLAAGIGEHSERPPPISAVRFAAGKSRAREFVDDPAGLRAGKHDPATELLHTQPPPRRGVELEQDVIPAQGQPPTPAAPSRPAFPATPEPTARATDC